MKRQVNWKTRETYSIDKDILVDLYVKKELSTRKCAELLGLPTQSSVIHHLQKYGVGRRDRLRAVRMGVAKRRSYKGKQHPQWKGGHVTVKCDCGQARTDAPSRLKQPWICRDCSHVAKVSIVGQRFGRLCVLADAGLSRHHKSQWLCECECGHEKIVLANSLLTGRTISCGCYQDECRIGESNHNWNGGSSHEPYCREWTGSVGKELKKDIRERDDHRCQNPHCDKDNPQRPVGMRQLPVHHVDDDKKNCHPHNLITLCVSCNFRATQDRPYWQQLYSSMMDFRAMSVPFQVGSSEAKEVFN